MDIPVGASWGRISTWLAEYAPVTAAAIRLPAGQVKVRRTERAVGRPLPADVLVWWGLMDGVAEADYRAGFPIAPFYLPLPVAAVAGTVRRPFTVRRPGLLSSGWGACHRGRGVFVRVLHCYCPDLLDASW